jgi:hypothetical protein
VGAKTGIHGSSIFFVDGAAHNTSEDLVDILGTTSIAGVLETLGGFKSDKNDDGKKRHNSDND